MELVSSVLGAKYDARKLELVHSVNDAESVLAFWTEGDTHITRLIEQAKHKGIPVNVIRY